MKYTKNKLELNKLNKIFLIFSIVIISFLFLYSNNSTAEELAAGETSPVAPPAYNISNTGNSINDIAQPAGYQTSGNITAYTVVGNLIKVMLSFLGILFLILVIVSGFQWMTAEGNEDGVKKAKARIKNATIGLAIVVLAYSLTYFILDILLTQTIK